LSVDKIMRGGLQKFRATARNFCSHIF